MKIRRYGIVYTLSLTIHLVIFVLLFLFPLRIGPDDFWGRGSAIQARLVMEDNKRNERGNRDNTTPYDYQRKRDIHDVVPPKENVEETTSWSIELPAPRKEEGPDFEILGIGGKEATGFREALPPAGYSASFEGFQGSFDDYVGLLRRLGLDVVFVLDATGSMEWIIQEAKAKMANMMNVIKRLVPIARVGIVVYRDQKKESCSFLTKAHPLTINVRELQTFLNSIEAKEGGDLEEAVEEGLRVAVDEMLWRKNAKKVIILVGDAPPHKADLSKALTFVQEFRDKGGFVSAIDTTHEANDESFSHFDSTSIMNEFMTIAEIGHGEASSLALEGKVIRHLIIQTFGSRWKDNLLEYIRYF